MAFTFTEISETVTTTEWSLTTDTAGPDADTTDCIVQVFLDLNALIAGDQFRLRFYEKVASADTQRLVAEWYFDGAQAMPNFVSPSFIVGNGWDFTIIKIAGTDRTITSSVRKIT